ncbi:MAG TPA: ribosome biogenesis GTP-binding protein YihA/YsxC [Firmicutes bacterium]|nr:ribosome biogenesis GTP-binding protein YihA/YsxC [Bacillota bacterium]
MIIKKASFITSAAGAKDMIVSELPQVAVVGKSNVGKSSFINYLANDGKLARTSKEPGRTRLINYFLFNEDFILTDLPGYGFARVSREEKKKWAATIEDYLDNEENLRLVCFLVDIRHDPTEDDKIMYNYLFKRAVPFIIVATKSDKIAKSKVKNQLRHLASVLKVGMDNILPVSSQNKTGKEEVLEKIEKIVFHVAEE